MASLQAQYLENSYPTQTSPTKHIVDEIRNKIETAKQEISRIQRNSPYHVSPCETETYNVNPNIKTENSLTTGEPKIIDPLQRHRYNYENRNPVTHNNISRLDTSMNREATSE